MSGVYRAVFSRCKIRNSINLQTKQTACFPSARVHQSLFEEFDSRFKFSLLDRFGYTSKIFSMWPINLEEVAD